MLTDADIAALKKGTKLYCGFAMEDAAYVAESTYLGVTRAGKARIQGEYSASSQDFEKVKRHYHLTKVGAAKEALAEAEEMFEKAQKALREAQKLVSDASLQEVMKGS